MLNWGRHHAQCLPAWKQSGPYGAKSAHVEPSWAHLGLMLGQVGPMLSHVGPILGLHWHRLGLCWLMSSYLGSDVGAMFGPSMLKRSYDAIFPFPPRAPSWSSKPRKNRCFSTSPRWNSLPPRGPKHRKKTKFLTPQAKYTVNYRDFSWPGVVQGWVGGRAGSPITFGYTTEGLRQGHGLASWPAPGFKGLRPDRRAPDFWCMVWEEWAEILRANPGRAMLNWGKHN